jgi:flagellar biosynthesis GTPase FlhF
MKVAAFLAETPAAALERIHAQLGPEAVVLSVRPLPASGLARLWQRHRVEVLACVEEDGAASGQVRGMETSVPLAQVSPRSVLPSPGQRPLTDSESRSGRVRSISAGVEPASSRPHVLVGPPGVGKTTLLCKWLVATALNESDGVRLWRLDGASANTAELLSLYGEMFGVTIERFWNHESPMIRSGGELCLVDIPGVETEDSQALEALQTQLRSMSAHVHLVLNAVYESSVLSRQLRAFSVLQPEDVSFTHLDEESRPEKLQQVIAGSNCALRFLAGGQKIPGHFERVTGAMASEPMKTGASQHAPESETTWQRFC